MQEQSVHRSSRDARVFDESVSKFEPVSSQQYVCSYDRTSLHFKNYTEFAHYISPEVLICSNP